MKLYIIRHGEYVYKHNKQGRKLVHLPDSPLSPLGELQMRRLSEELKRQGITINAFYTSPYPRAKQSADVLAKELKVSNIFEIERLKDLYPNSADGRLYAELEAVGGDIFAHPLGGRPQETLEHLVERARSTIQSIIAEAVTRNYTSIGLVSHGDTLSALDWVLKHSDNPAFYAQMRDAFYLQKAEACEYTLDEQLRLIGEGRIITTGAVKESVEGFRDKRTTSNF